MEPLAQLKDIHLPEQIHNYPLAPGWWLLAFLLVMLIIVVVRKTIKYRQLRKSKKLALNQLNNNSLTNNELVSLIKWAALQYFPRVEVANLYGTKLKEFMVQSLPEKQQAQFNELTGSSFETLYLANPTVNSEPFQQATKLWLQYALPLKKPEGANND